MSTTEPATAGTGQDWRGVASEDTAADALTEGASLALAARSRALLGSLLAPHRSRAWLALALAVGQTATALAGPLLVAAFVDTAVPAALAGDTTRAVVLAVAYAAVGLASAGLRSADRKSVV